MPQDQLFKELLQSFFREFLELFYPEVAERLDFERGLTFLDKETFTDFPEGSRREADLVVRVYTMTGEPELILVHIEVQTKRRGDFAYRMFEYYTLLRLRHKIPVFPMVLYLAPGAGGLVEESYREQLFGWEVLSFHYKAVGVPDLRSEDYERRSNPLGPALSALMKPGHTPRVLRRMMIMAQRSILTADDARRALLLNVVDKYLPLDAEEEAEFQRLLGEPEYREVKQMVTVYEKRGIEEGIQQGIERGALQGKRDAVLLIVRSRFDHVPEAVGEKIAALSAVADLDAMLKRAVIVSKAEDLLVDE